ncbi:MAG: dienelactone hydrolase family protein [Rhodobacteraceae bacterium]|nr:dienelactone hydrolase family protein [Paracoccaceae bacterium]
MFETLTARDGHRLACWMQPAEGPARGGLVILQEIFGVTDQLKGVAARYAAQGLNVAIPALFDRQDRDAVIAYDHATKGRDLMVTARLADAMADTLAAVDALRAKGGKVAVMGFCWGGGLALRAALELDIACAVSFYGTRLTDYLGPVQKAPVMGHFGVHDDHTPPGMLEAVRAALPDLQMFLYDAGHAFANEARPAHVPAAADLAHQRTAAFLAQHLGK